MVFVGFLLIFWVGLLWKYRILNILLVYYRFDVIVVDVEFEDKLLEDFSWLVDIFYNSCEKVVGEYEEKFKEDLNFDGKFFSFVFVNIELGYIFFLSIKM